MIRVEDRNSVNPVVDKSEVMNNIKNVRWGEDPGRTGWQMIGLTETSSVGSNPASAPCFILFEYCFLTLQTVSAGLGLAGPPPAAEGNSKIRRMLQTWPQMSALIGKASLRCD